MGERREQIPPSLTCLCRILKSRIYFKTLICKVFHHTKPHLLERQSLLLSGLVDVCSQTFSPVLTFLCDFIFFPSSSSQFLSPSFVPVFSYSRTEAEGSRSEPHKLKIKTVYIIMWRYTINTDLISC